MPSHSDDALFLRLALTRGIGPRTAHKLLLEFGDIANIFDASEATLAKLVSDKVASALRSEPSGETRKQIDEALAWAEDPAHHLLTWSHAAYPKALLESGDAPILLYANGSLDVLKRPALAMVGSRNCSQGGADTAEAFAEALAKSGVAIVSGLALGIDAAAHTGALRAGASAGTIAANYGSTIAVVGTGIDRVYPARNKTLAHSIAEHGLIVSEYPMGTAPLAENFPRRNRIISGLSLGVLVVEASMQSGSLITARLAGEQGREVFAIPGSIHSTFHKGCHYLIKQGAKLVESAQDILEELRIESNAPGTSNVNEAKSKKSTKETSNAADEGLLAYIEHAPIDVDTLVARSGMSVEEVVTELTLLELNNRIESLAGGLWQRR
jgi:DNA processing protein